MFVLPLLALLLLGCSVTLVFRAVALPRIKAAERIRGIDLYGFNPPIPSGPQATARNPLFSGIAGAVGIAFSRWTKGAASDEARKALVSAGLYRVTPTAVMGYRVLLAVVLGLCGVSLGSNAGVAGAVIVAALCGAIGWMVPMIFVRRLATHRLTAIDRELPDLIDLLVVTVEAGAGLSSSLALAATKFKGPLAQELRILGQEQRLGRSLAEALMGMLERADTPNMRSFVRSVVQGETLGVSIGTIMRNHAPAMRNRRRASAQEQAQKAPVKMLFPLVFMVLPAFILTILGPALFELAESLN